MNTNVQTAAARAVRRVVKGSGFDLLRRNFYSPLVNVDELPPDTFDRRSALAGIHWDLDRYEAFIRDLAPLIEEFEPPPGFEWDNGLYGPVETELLYAMIRRRRPARIIELGSGSSSLTIAAACRRNATEGSHCRYLVFDPYPQDFVKDGIAPWTLEATGACDIPVDLFATLDAGDILFVDTTHTVKVGSDVNRIILDVLPTLEPGVLVHIHDVFVPYEYPRDFLLRQCHWQEQYLLQALLAENPNFEVLFPAWSFHRDRPDVINELFPWHDGRVFGPGAFWIRRR